ncbi:MAG: hypothetical protein JNM00_06615, partial [Flavobacteriales bacterium]|nr:hypothetical protein [Flavobacteriales bacterium]
MRAIFINVFALVIGLFTGLMLQAQPGALDQTFGDGGTLSVDFDSLNDEAKGIIVQPDGKILVAGSASIDYVNKFAIARLNPDGTFDTTFGTNGKVETQMGNSNITFGECIALQPDGKIIVAGSVFIGTTYYMAVARYNSDGQLDASFSGDGMMTYSPGGSVFIKAIAIQDDGAILLAGSSGLLGAATHISVLKLNSDGTIDESFGDGTGQLVTEVGESSGALGLAIQSNGNIIVAGYTNDGAYNDVVVVRYSENGVLD